MRTVMIKKKHPAVVIPKYATEGSAGFDFHVDNFLQIYSPNVELHPDFTPCKIEEFIDKDNNSIIYLLPFYRLLVGTGLFMEIPKGYELQIRDRSGNCLKKGIKVLNSPGTIDSDYRGEIGIILQNTNQFTISVNVGDKIAQGVLAKYETASFLEVETLDETHRLGGFGSTGL